MTETVATRPDEMCTFHLLLYEMDASEEVTKSGDVESRRGAFRTFDEIRLLPLRRAEHLAYAELVLGDGEECP